MLNNKNEIQLEGEVIEFLPNTTFRVQTQEGRLYLCTMAGRMRLNRIRILPGDRVRFVSSPYDDGKGRIVYRL